MAIVRGYEGCAYMVDPNLNPFFLRGISEWRINYQQDIKPMYIASNYNDETFKQAEYNLWLNNVLSPQEQQDPNKLKNFKNVIYSQGMYLKVPFSGPGQGTLEFTSFYDDTNHPFTKVNEWFPAGEWFFKLCLRDSSRKLDTLEGDQKEFPLLFGSGYLNGLELQSHVRNVPIFKVTLSIMILYFDLANAPKA